MTKEELEKQTMEWKNNYILKLEKENERLKGDLELWESGACKATNLDKCGVVKELEQKLEQSEKDLADYQFNYPTIKELQEENAELKEKLTKKADTNHSLVEQMADLESENVELRERIKTLEQIKQEHTAYTIKVETERTLVKEQLTKAKELLGKLLVYLKCQVWITDKPIMQKDIAEAEQFLKDCDIDNAIQQANKGLDFDKIADEMEQDLKDSEVIK